jgi:hypothetical protein
MESFDLIADPRSSDGGIARLRPAERARNRRGDLAAVKTSVLDADLIRTDRGDTGAFAGVPGGYSANLLVGTVNPLLAGQS